MPPIKVFGTRRVGGALIADVGPDRPDEPRSLPLEVPVLAPDGRISVEVELNDAGRKFQAENTVEVLGHLCHQAAGVDGGRDDGQTDTPVVVEGDHDEPLESGSGRY